MSTIIVVVVVVVHNTGSAFAALKDDGSVITWGDGSYGGTSTGVSSDLASGVDTVYGSEFHESLSTSVHDYRAPPTTAPTEYPTTAPTEYPTPMPSPAPTDDSSNSNLLDDLAAGTGLGIGIVVGLAVLGVGVGVYICVNVRAPAKTAVIFKELRIELDDLLLRTWESPELDTTKEPLVKAIVDVLTA